jgi:DNA-binding LacI/PurR family transcriptional regulator
MPRLPTVSDVGRVAGVSRQTVSNVLNAPDVVRPDTRARVEAAIAELGYRPHASARRLRTRKSSTLGIRLDPVTDGISGSVLDRFLHALTEQADARGLRVLLFTASDPDDEIRQFARLRDGADIDAFVLTSTFYEDPRTEWLIEQGIPFVTFGRPWGIDDMDDPAHAWVDVDGRAGVAASTRHALETAGPRVAYLGWPASSGTGDDRRRGWADAMGGCDPALAMQSTDAVGAARAAVLDFAESGTPFDAVVCASDSLALGALMALGGRVPVIGFDDTPVAAAIGFSSVAQPLVEVARGALDLLLAEPVGAAAAPAPRHRLVSPRLVVRTPGAPTL